METPSVIHRGSPRDLGVLYGWILMLLPLTLVAVEGLTVREWTTSRAELDVFRIQGKLIKTLRCLSSTLSRLPPPRVVRARIGRGLNA